ncbi:ubiquitin family domain-containing protein [Ditylenchus destructor]|uniref:Ubiquitin family domain-containing protein n=1 Tax=Ditylenchus destructor TaxID=166010 RepID=A0AAD4MHL6_9BILA|nr:ubiquitin family domain-containing protein [Ditylenchus destructor]
MSNTDDEKHLRCGICTEFYVEPKSLNCGHTFCLKCVETMTADGAIVCPECRKSTTIPPEGLPTIYAIMDGLSHSIRNLLSPIIHRTPSLASLTSAADTADTFSIRFLKFDGSAFTLEGFHTYDDVSDVKPRVAHRIGLPTDTFYLLFCGRCLADDKALDEYGIKAGSTVHVMFRLKGGNAQ